MIALQYPYYWHCYVELNTVLFISTTGIYTYKKYQQDIRQRRELLADLFQEQTDYQEFDM